MLHCLCRLFPVILATLIFSVPLMSESSPVEAEVLDLLSSHEREYLRNRGPVRIAVDPSWPPYEWIDESGVYRGMGAEFMELISRKIGFEVVLVPSSTWEETLRLAEAGSCDVVPMLQMTTQRMGYLNFTSPYVYSPSVLVTREGTGEIGGFSDLAGRRVSLVEGYYAEEFLRERFPGASVVSVPSNKEAVLMVLRGEVFAAAVPLMVFSSIVREEGLVGLSAWSHDSFEYQLRMGVRKDDPTLLGILQKGLSSISGEERNAVLDRWNPLALQNGLNYRTFGWIMASAGSVLSLSVFMAYRFRSQVRELMRLNRELAVAKEALEEGNRRLEAMSRTDRLTGLANRYGIEEFLTMAVQRARRGVPFSVAIGDIDHFKAVNDNYGHEKGDQVLAQVARILRDSVRTVDLVGRWGGEEFLLVFDGMEQESLFPVTDRIRKYVEDADFGLGRGLTISFGAAAFPVGKAGDLAELLKSADDRLYRAKREGRNRVVVS